MTKLTTEDWNKSFEITSVSREDLKDCLTKEEIEQFTDADMILLAGKMSDYYLNLGYWSDLAQISKEILKEKENRGPIQAKRLFRKNTF